MNQLNDLAVRTAVERLTKGGFEWRPTPAQAKVDSLSSALAKLPQTECPLVHRFTPGLYIREIFMPAGTIVVSKIHKTEHPFIVSQGQVNVWIEGQGVERICAPHCGITRPGTRRVLYIREDCIWTTFHVTELTDPEAIVADVTYQPEPSVTEAWAHLEREALRELLLEVPL